MKQGAFVLAVGLVLLSTGAPAAAADRGDATSRCAVPANAYGGTLVDAMSQIDERMSFNQAVRLVREAGVNRLALFARSRKRLGENEREVLALAQRHPDLIVVGAPKYFLSRGDLGDRFIEATVNGIREHRYAFVGEVLYSHADKSHGEQTADGERYVDPSMPGTAKFLARLGGSVPLMTHWEVYDWERDWPLLHKLYADWPEQAFIVPHMAFGNPDQVRTVLDAHPNVFMTISKKDKAQRALSDRSKAELLGGAMVDRCGVLEAEWKALLEQNRDRFLFATDAHKNDRWLDYGKHVDSLRRILGQLSPAAAAAIGHGNAERLYRLKAAG